MNYYYSVFVISDNKVNHMARFEEDQQSRHELETIVRCIFDALDETYVVDNMIKLLHTQGHHVVFNVFAHVAEIHVFRVTRKESKQSYESLNQNYEPYELTSIRYKPKNNSDTESD